MERPAILSNRFSVPILDANGRNWQRILGPQLQFAAVFSALLVALLFDTSFVELGTGSRLIFRAFSEPLHASGSQWIFFLALSVYWIIFAALHTWLKGLDCLRPTGARFWLTCLLVVNGLSYSLRYSGSAQSLAPLLLLAGSLVGQGFILISHSQPDGGSHYNRITLGALVALLLLVCFLHPPAERIFYYRGQVRWSGPWENPNVFGLLIGLGLVLSMGLIADRAKISEFSSSTTSAHRESPTRGWLKPLIVIGCGAGLVTLGWGLLNSYSRGAWCATFVGSAYFIWWLTMHSATRGSRFIKRNWISLCAFGLAFLVLTFWVFKDWELLIPLRRVLSIGNPNDFSWLNRIAAWMGLLQMMADRPFIGFGWNNLEIVYNYYYLPLTMAEGAAIQTNDYLKLGVALGTPALICFVVYVWFSVFERIRSRDRGDSTQQPSYVNSEGCVANMKYPIAEFDADKEETQNSLYPTMTSDKCIVATCRAGALVMLVGFWFDGALFQWSTAFPFWILIEIGAESTRRRQLHG
jgi:hypothetical protein